MREIVVGVDGSPASASALDHAVLEARATDRPLRVVHGWTTPVWMGGIPGFGYNVLATRDDSARHAAQVLDQQLEALRTRLPESADVKVLHETLEGDAKRVLVEASQDAGLLVVGGHGDGLVRGALLGSVTNHVLHHATCPVMVVPDPGSPSRVVQRVIVGVDGSTASRSAMRWALEAAQRHTCPLICLHSWLLTSLPGRPPMHYVPSLREYETEAQQWLDQEICDALPDRSGVDVRAELSHSAQSWGLLDKAGPDDLLVLGSRGRGGFAELLLGSVVRQCAEHARGVLVVVRAGQERLEP